LTPGSAISGHFVKSSNHWVPHIEKLIFQIQFRRVELRGIQILWAQRINSNRDVLG